MSSHLQNSWAELQTCSLSVNIFGKSGNVKIWAAGFHRVFYTTNLQNTYLDLNLLLCISTKLSSSLAHGLILSVKSGACSWNSELFNNGVCLEWTAHSLLLLSPSWVYFLPL